MPDWTRPILGGAAMSDPEDGERPRPVPGLEPKHVDQVGAFRAGQDLGTVRHPIQGGRQGRGRVGSDDLRERAVQPVFPALDRFERNGPAESGQPAERRHHGLEGQEVLRGRPEAQPVAGQQLVAPILEDVVVIEPSTDVTPIAS